MIDGIKRLSVKIPIYEYYDTLKYLETGIYLGREEYEYEVDLDEYRVLIFKFDKTKILSPNLIIKISVKDKLTGFKEQIINYCFINKEDLGIVYQFEYDKLKIYFKFDLDIENKVNDKDIFVEVMLNRFESIKIISEIRNLLDCSDFRNEWDLVEFSYIALYNIDNIDVLATNIIDKLEYYGIDNEDILNDINKLITKLLLNYYSKRTKTKTLNKEIISFLLAQLYNQSLTKAYRIKSVIKEKIEEMFIHHINVMANEICK